MKPVINLILVLFSLAPVAIYGQQKTTHSSAQSIDVTHVVLDLRFDWEKKLAIGTATIHLTLLQPSEILLLDAIMLDIDRISFKNGKELKFEYDETGNMIRVHLGEIRKNKEKLELRIDYKTRYVNEFDPLQPGGCFGNGLRFFQSTNNNPIKRRQIWAQSEPQGNRYWFPAMGHLRDLRTTEFIATVDKQLTVISNGKLLELKENSDHTHTFHYASDVPYPEYLTAFVVGEFKDLLQDYQGIPLHTFCYPDEVQAAIATTARLPEMMKFLSEKSGMSYPFKRYSQVMVQNYPFPSLTGQHMFSVISDNMIDDHGTHADFLYLWDGVEFNALASQWFGNVITPARWDDVWLTKAFAEYFEGLYTSHANGNAEYLLWYHPFESASVFNDWNSGNRHPIVTNQYTSLESISNDSYAKYRGALVLRMLRKELGDAEFFNAIRFFIKDNAFKPVTTQDFQNSIQKTAGRNMQWFFNQWIYRTGHPVFEVNTKYQSDKKQLTLNVDQVQQMDSTLGASQVPYFQGKVVVEIDDELKTIELVAKEHNSFSFSLAHPPRLVQFDFENTWISEIRFDKTLDDLLYQFQHDDDMTGRQNAMVELLSIVKDSITSPSDKAKVNEAFYKVINSNLYWRMRMMALGQWRTILQPPYDSKTTELLLQIIQKEKSWLRMAAINMLGATADQKFADLYISLLADSSDRVVNAAATALGKSRSPKAYDALLKLKERPSWKSQSLMSCLNGLAQLGDPRGADVAIAALKDNHSPRWFLANGWDYPLIAAQTLASLGKGAEAFTIVSDRLNEAIKEDQLDDIFEQVLLMSVLEDPKALDVFKTLRQKFQENQSALAALENYEAQLKTSLNK